MAGWTMIDDRQDCLGSGKRGMNPLETLRKFAGRWVMVFCLVILGLQGCAVVPPEHTKESGPPAAGGRTLVLWMLSDIQTPTVAERKSFERTIDDVAALSVPIDLAVIAGDLMASRSQDEAFTWFLATREKAGIAHWYEIAGNHDVRSKPLFHKYFPIPSYYAVEVGNILLLLLSDELPSSKTEIFEPAFKWWREMVEKNPDRIIITVTHAQLKNSGLLGSSIKDRIIDDSERFENVLRNAKVAVWASGHCHLPHGTPFTVNRQEELGGTFFMNVSAIIEGGFTDSQSRFLFFAEGSDKVLIRSRNHPKGHFEEGLDITLELGKTFVWDGAAPRKLLPPGL